VQTVSVQVDAESGNVIEKPVAENDAFKVFAPEPDTEVGQTFTVRGQARVFEAAFSWTLEDGHSILAEGHEMTDAGAPEWGNFEFDVTFDKATNSTLTLILWVGSAKDGEPEHELMIPLKPQEQLIDWGVEE